MFLMNFSPDVFIIAIFLYQTLKQCSYREVLQELKYLGFKTIAGKTGQCYIADATGFAYGDNFIIGLPFIADKGYDSISVVQKILGIGLIHAIKIKQSLRVKIKHPLRQLSKNIAKKLAVTWAIFWNFYMILIYVFLFILSVLVFRRSFLIFGTLSLFLLNFSQRYF
jgi:hypothetical protein